VLRRSLKTYFVYAPLTADLCATKVAARGSTGAVFVPGARTVALPKVQARVHHATWQHGPVRSVRSDIFHGYISPVRMQVRLNAEPSGQSTEPLTTLTTGFPTAPQEVRIVCEQTFHRSAGACRFAARATARAETRRQRFRSASVRDALAAARTSRACVSSWCVLRPSVRIGRVWLLRTFGFGVASQLHMPLVPIGVGRLKLTRAIVFWNVLRSQLRQSRPLLAVRYRPLRPAPPHHTPFFLACSPVRPQQPIVRVQPRGCPDGCGFPGLATSRLRRCRRSGY
jgi:hypothetical protein